MGIRRIQETTGEPWKSAPERAPRVSPDLVDWLKKNFPHRCIRPGETENEARAYAAKVELAEKLIQFGLKSAEHPGFSIQED